MATDSRGAERKRAIARRISAVLLALGAVVVVSYLLFVPGRAADDALTPLGQRLTFVFTRPLVMTLLVVTVAWLTCKTLFLDPGSLLERCASAAWGVGAAACYPEATREIGGALVLGGLAASALALVLAARRDRGLFTRPL
jgi:hypothetical protein